MKQKQSKTLIRAALGLCLIFGITSYTQSNVSQQNENNMNDIKTAKSNVTVFLNNPTNYTVDCASKGEVLSAMMDADRNLKITYHSIWHDGDHSGVFKGKYDESTNRFDGRYKTNDGRFEGEINFTFSKNGEANGTWDYADGTTYIRLKK